MYLLLAKLIGQLNVRTRPDHHCVVDPDVVLIVFPALGNVQRRIAIQIRRDTVAQMLQIEHGRRCGGIFIINIVVFLFFVWLGL